VQQYRGNKNAVFSNSWYVPASWAQKFNDGKPDNLKDFLHPNTSLKLGEETNLSGTDFESIEPVALLREFKRGGKPQLHLVGRV
jgi:hypothetical protein